MVGAGWLSPTAPDEAQEAPAVGALQIKTHTLVPTDPMVSTD